MIYHIIAASIAFACAGVQAFLGEELLCLATLFLFGVAAAMIVLRSTTHPVPYHK